MRSVYVHIPFCKHICSYCDFCKMNYNEQWADKYIEVLKDEIEEKYNNEIIKTLYIGGGTPSCLSLKQLSFLFKTLKKFRLDNNYEFTFECNLEDLNEEKLQLLKDNSVNRLSIGIESFNKDNLDFMQRSNSFEQALEIIKIARRIGFNNINVDLMYALPNQNLNQLKKDLSLVLKLNVEHISTYSLLIEEHTQIKIMGEKNIDEELDAKMYEYIVKKLKKSGYNHYEISNFAKPGYESLHNLTYWNNDYYYGFGLSAHGYEHGLRYQNTKNLNEYFNHNFVVEKSILSKTDIMENEVMLGFRKIQGINLNDFFVKYELNFQDVFPAIKPLLKSKDLIYKNGYIFINPDKLYIMNEILLKII